MARIDGYSWLPKITSILLGLIIFFSATQLGLHFWPLSTLVYGVRIDYLSPTIYFLDLLIILYLALKRSDLVGCKPNQKPTRSDLVGILVPILFVNLLFSQNPLATLSWSLHFLLYLLFFAALGSDPLRKSWRSAKMFSQTAKTSGYTGSDPQGIILAILPLSMFFVVALALIQVFLGHSVGGLLYWVGERTVAVGSPAVATASFLGHVVLRAYATFGHPNVLAGWLVISLLITLRLVGLQSPKSASKSSVRWSDPLRKSWPTDKMFSRPQNTIGRPGQTLLVTLTSLGVLLAQSRAAALSLFGIVIPIYFLRSWRRRLLYFSILLFAIYYFLISGSLTRGGDLSLTDRASLQGVSLQAIATYPLFGTGSQASISTYTSIAPNFRLLQPDHDSFTLFLSWFGLFSVLALFLGSDLLRKSWPTAKMFNRTSNTNGETRSDTLSVLLPLLPLPPLLLLDHYLLTSPQGLFILLLYLSCGEK